METESTLSPGRAHLLADQRALIERPRRGDASAHRDLYEAPVERIYRLTYRLTGLDHLARELTQDTFVRAFASIDGFRGHSAFGTWLHTIAVSVSLTELQRRRRESAREAPLEEALTMSRTASLSDPILRERLMTAVNALPEGCRTVFMLHDAEGYTHEEIATAPGVTPGTSKAQLSRGRAKVRIALGAFTHGVVGAYGAVGGDVLRGEHREVARECEVGGELVLCRRARDAAPHWLEAEGTHVDEVVARSFLEAHAVLARGVSRRLLRSPIRASRAHDGRHDPLAGVVGDPAANDLGDALRERRMPTSMAPSSETAAIERRGRMSGGCLVLVYRNSRWTPYVPTPLASS